MCQQGPSGDVNAVHSTRTLQRVDHLLERNLPMLAMGDGRIVALEARIGSLKIEAPACLAVGVADPARPHADRLRTRRRVCDLNLITKTIRGLAAKYRIQASVCRKAEDRGSVKLSEFFTTSSSTTSG